MGVLRGDLSVAAVLADQKAGCLGALLGDGGLHGGALDAAAASPALGLPRYQSASLARALGAPTSFAQFLTPGAAAPSRGARRVARDAVSFTHGHDKSHGEHSEHGEHEHHGKGEDEAEAEDHVDESGDGELEKGDEGYVVKAGEGECHDGKKVFVCVDEDAKVHADHEALKTAATQLCKDDKISLYLQFLNTDKENHEAALHGADAVVVFPKAAGEGHCHEMLQHEHALSKPKVEVLAVDSEDHRLDGDEHKINEAGIVAKAKEAVEKMEGGDDTEEHVEDEHATEENGEKHHHEHGHKDH